MKLSSTHLILATATVSKYNIDPDITSADEGDTITFTITTEEVADGTVLYFSTSGMQDADFTDNTRVGSATINSNTATITRTLSNDLTVEGVETFFLQLRVYSSSGPVVANSAVVTVADTSVPTITVTPDDTSLNEGQTVTYSVVSSGYPDGTYYYTVQSLSGTVNGSDFFNDSDAQGTFTLSNDSAEFSQTIRRDFTTGEGTESYKLNIRSDSAGGTIITNTPSITISDTATLSYSVTSDDYAPEEDTAFSVLVETTGHDPADTLYYTTLSYGGFSPADDFTDGLSSGSFNVSGSKIYAAGGFQKTLDGDGIVETGESFQFQIRTGSTSGPVVATSATYTANDEPPTYAVTPDVNTVYEGSTYNQVVFTVTTTNVADGTTLYYSIDGSIQSGDFTDNAVNGNFTVNSNTGTITKTLAINFAGAALFDDNETFRVRIRTDSTTGTIVATSSYVTKRVAYKLTQDPDGVVYEGGTVTYTLTTRSITNGSTISYGIVQGGKAGSISGSDFTDGVTQGNITVSASGSGSSATGSQTFTKTLEYDSISDSGEDWALVLYDGPNKTGNIVAYSLSDANDLGISVSSDPDYTITRTPGTVDEGDTITYTVSTIGVPDGTVLYWTHTGMIDTADFDDNAISGTVTISTSNNVGSGSFTRTLVEDATTEGTEILTMQIRTGSISGPVVATAQAVTVLDTSAAPTYDISPSATSVNEGSSVTFTVTTTSVPDGTTLYWTTTGTVDADDFSDSTTSGTVTINSNTGSITRTLTEDVTTEGSETFALQLRTTSTSGTIQDTSTTVTVSDTSQGPTGNPFQYTIYGSQTELRVEPGAGETTIYVDWGDGSAVDSYTTASTATHTYSSTGNHTVKVYGGGRLSSFESSDTINAGFTFEQWGDFKVSNAYDMFDMFDYVKSGSGNRYNVFRYTATDTPDLSLCTNCHSMFYQTGAQLGPTFGNSSFNSWNVSTITSMQLMFASSPFNANIGAWDVRNVTNMAFMFSSGAGFNQDISGWNTSNVTDMRQMFASQNNFNANIGGWNTSKVTNMASMFVSCRDFNGNIGSWDTSNVTNMTNMFLETESFNQNLSSWDTSKVTNMAGMFGAAEAFNNNVSTWDTSNVTDMYQMFKGVTGSVFNQDLNSWNTYKVTNMANMFRAQDFFNQDLSGWNTGNVTNMAFMFYSANVFNGDISTWNVRKVTNFSNMFFGALAFNSDISGWVPTAATDLSWMFYSANAFNSNIASWFAGANNLTNLAYTFGGGNMSFNQNINLWTVTNVTNMSGTFANNSFNQPLSAWATTNVTNMSGMFYSAVGSPFSQNIYGWNTAACVDMSAMFRNADSFNHDIKTIGNQWNTSNVTNMAFMFQDNSGFDQDISNWNVDSVTDSYRFDYNTNVNWTAAEKPTF